MTLARRIRLLFFVPAVLWMLLIFFFSAMPDNVSKDQSDYVSLRLHRIITRTLSGESKEAMEEWEELEENMPLFSVRKVAHVIEYMVLCILLYIGLAGTRRARVLSFVCAVLYACSDEIHQLFVPGREGMLVDVTIDCGGALAGLAVILMTGGLILRLKQRLMDKLQERSGRDD